MTNDELNPNHGRRRSLEPQGFVIWASSFDHLLANTFGVRISSFPEHPCNPCHPWFQSLGVSQRPP